VELLDGPRLIGNEEKEQCLHRKREAGRHVAQEPACLIDRAGLIVRVSRRRKKSNTDIFEVICTIRLPFSAN
jgi:hypothetical protein